MVCIYGRSLLEIGSLKCVPCTSPSAFRYHLFLSWRTHYCTYRGISCREWNVQQCIPLRTLLVGSINAISFWFLPVPAGTYQPTARREPSQVSMNLQSNLFYGCGVVIKHWSNYTTESIGWEEHSISGNGSTEVQSKSTLHRPATTIQGSASNEV